MTYSIVLLSTLWFLSGILVGVTVTAFVVAWYLGWRERRRVATVRQREEKP